MKVVKDAVVSIDYKLTDPEGKLLDESNGEPLAYLHGHGQIVPGLERALEGKNSGDAVSVAVDPEDGYGTRDEAKVIAIRRAQLPKRLKPEIGMQLSAEDQDGDTVPVWITAFDDEQVTLDGNHPLAGQTLHFAVTVREVRVATADELQHGHVHGADGHHH